MNIPRLCSNCIYFLPNSSMGWCLQFYKRTEMNIEPRHADYCRNVEHLCGKTGKYFVPNNINEMHTDIHRIIEDSKPHKLN